jgi:hypothetical protein
MEYIEKIKKMLCKELEEYAEMGKMKSASDLDMIWKLTDTVKNLDKIEMLEDDGGYSEARGMHGRSYMHGSSYDDEMMYSERRGRGRNAKRDRMGRYSSEVGSYEGGSSYDDYSEERMDRRYSRDDVEEHLMHKLGQAMEDADPKQRKILEEAMQKIRRV